MKLNDTNSNIAKLKIKIEEIQPKLVQKNAELKVSLVQVNADKAMADSLMRKKRSYMLKLRLSTRKLLMQRKMQTLPIA